MKIAAKISVAFISLALILTTLALSIQYALARKSLEKEIFTRLEATAYSRGEEITLYLNMLKMSVGQLSKSIILEIFLETPKDDPKRAGAFENAMTRLAKTKEANPAIFEYMVLDTDGMVVASSDPATIGEDKSADSYFTGGQKGVYIKDVYYSEKKKMGLIGVAAPITDSATGALRGVLAARIKLGELYRLTMDRKGLGNTGEVFIVNKYGYMITPSRFLTNTFLKQKVDTEDVRKCLERRDSCNERSELIAVSDYRGVPVLATHMYIPEMQWAVAIEIDKAEALEPLTRMRFIMAALLLLAFFTAFLTARFMASAITEPIHRLRRGTEIIGEGNLDYKVGTQVQDEIGQLSRAFDAMTDDLKKKIVSLDSLNAEMTLRRQAQSRLARNEERARRITELEASLLDQAPMEEKLKKITDGIVRIFDVDFCRIWVAAPGDRCNSGCVHAEATAGPHVCEPQNRNRCLHLIAGSGRYTHIDGGAHARVPFGAYKIGGIASGEYPSFLTNDVQNDPRVHDREWARELGLVSFAGFQLRPPRGEITGVLALFSRHAISPEEFTLLEGISDVAITVIQSSVREKERKESEEKFRTMFESSKDAMMMLHPSRGFFDANRATLELFGFKDKAEFLTMGPASVSPQYQADGKLSTVKAREMIATAMKEGSNFFEWTHKRFDGKEFFATVLLTRMEIKEEAVLQATVRDITEEKRSAGIIMNAAKEWATTFDSMVEGVSIHDPAFGILNVNSALCEILGKTREELIGKRCHEFFHGKDAPIYGCPLEKAGATGKKERAEIFEPFLNKWLAVSVSPIYDEKGKVARFIHVVSDITDRKTAESKLAEAMEVKAQFISTVSHELRTPMTAIREGIGIVLDGSAGAVSEDQKEFLGIAKRNVDRLSRLINDVLDYQKLESGRTVFRMQKANLNAVVEDVIKVMTPVAQAKGLSLKADLPPEAFETIFDKDKITQVLINLVNNAVKFTSQGGVTVGTSLDKGFITVSVKDTGLGIKEEDLPKLFRGFSQLETGASSKGSTGLGLAISKKIIQEHRGNIWVESRPGKGSDFKFTLPVKTKYKILLVDDEKSILTIYSRSLEEAGYEVNCSEKGFEAIAMIQKEKPDIIVLDMKLGDVSGYEVIGRLRGDRETAMIPILAMSGYTAELHKLEDKREDSSLASIAKPFKLEDLLVKIRALLKQEA